MIQCSRGHGNVLCDITETFRQLKRRVIYTEVCVYTLAAATAILLIKISNYRNSVESGYSIQENLFMLCIENRNL